jgi:integrase/recombinase XerD
MQIADAAKEFTMKFASRTCCMKTKGNHVFIWLSRNLLISKRSHYFAKRLFLCNQWVQNKYTSCICFEGDCIMGQAKVLTDRELKKILLYIAARSHATRNRCMFLLTHGSGMRVGEVAALRICDVLTKDGQIKDEIRLSAVQTKGDRGRTVVLSDRMQSEIRNYLCNRFNLTDLLAVTLTDTTRALFSNQKNPHRGFSASTACQMFHYWYRGANVEGSSHSGRRGFITNLANKGVSVHVLKELAGHLSIAVTEKYISKNPAMLRSAVELLH